MGQKVSSTGRTVLGLGFVVGAVGALLGPLVGCGRDPRTLVAELTIQSAQVARIGRTEATIEWQTNVPGDSRVDFALVSVGTATEGELESVSDQQYIPLFRDGGVTVSPEPGFDHVSNTRYSRAFTRNHRVVLDRLLPGRTYAATVLSSNGIGGEEWEFGSRLLFTTLP